MKRLLLAPLATVLLFAVGTTGAAPQDTTQTAPWRDMPWGELGVVALNAAPYPDDSRTTGYTRNGVDYLREGHYDDSSVAFAVPAGFKKDATVDLIVTMHGHGNTAENFTLQSNAGGLLEASGRNAIFVAPQGPKNVPDSGGGKFEKPGGFTAFLAETMAVLRKSGRVAPDAKLGSVALCGYSGGGRPVGYILRNGDSADAIREVWLIDCAYGQLDGLSKLAARPEATTRLRSVFTEHLSQENIELMSMICAGGGEIGVLRDPATTSTASDLTGPDPLPDAMKRHNALFIRTQLPHAIDALSVRYVARFMAER
ncbi:hypothetical protein CVU37_06065 [candidate division BRC1 bacterium HGW-BRC1-1]|jgi:hypothetical protein|nr:MAG: hypothetical protein CVU37_06065 [candidate division BRC1 bacterium HGW-BRC1-1]